jgi:hypothetical protein
VAPKRGRHRYSPLREDHPVAPALECPRGSLGDSFAPVSYGDSRSVVVDRLQWCSLNLRSRERHRPTRSAPLSSTARRNSRRAPSPDKRWFENCGAAPRLSSQRPLRNRHTFATSHRSRTSVHAGWLSASSDVGREAWHYGLQLQAGRPIHGMHPSPQRRSAKDIPILDAVVWQEQERSPQHHAVAPARNLHSCVCPKRQVERASGPQCQAGSRASPEIAHEAASCSR